MEPSTIILFFIVAILVYMLVAMSATGPGDKNNVVLLRQQVAEKDEIIKSLQIEQSTKTTYLTQEIKAARNDLEDHVLKFAEFKRVEVPKIRKEAIKKSKEVNTGFTSENFAMFMQGDLNPKDFRHLGDPIDFVVTCGADDVRNGVSDEVSEVVLLDVKTGNASLNKIQRRIRDAVVAGRVSFATLTINDEGVNYRFWRQDED
jgi:predicted Holliday junction resolvase-like endonuclease